MQATFSLWRALPSALCTQPRAARAPTRQIAGASVRWTGSRGGGGSRAGTQPQLAACSSIAEEVENLINASYGLGAEEHSWLEAWSSLTAPAQALPVAVNQRLSQLLRAFAAFRPEQKWRVAWMQLGTAERRQLAQCLDATSSVEAFLQKAAEQFEAVDDIPGPLDLAVWLVLAAAYSCCGDEAEAAATAAALDLAAAAAARDSIGGS